MTNHHREEQNWVVGALHAKNDKENEGEMMGGLVWNMLMLVRNRVVGSGIFLRERMYFV